MRVSEPPTVQHSWTLTSEVYIYTVSPSVAAAFKPKFRMPLEADTANCLDKLAAMAQAKYAHRLG